MSIKKDWEAEAPQSFGKINMNESYKLYYCYIQYIIVEYRCQ